MSDTNVPKNEKKSNLNILSSAGLILTGAGAICNLVKESIPSQISSDQDRQKNIVNVCPFQSGVFKIPAIQYQ